MNWLNEIDASWAWQPFEPDDDATWDSALAAHLFRRAGFGTDQASLTESLTRTPNETVDELISRNEEADSFRTVADSLAKTVLAGGDPMKLSAAWVYRLQFTPAQLLEKTTLFWHGHFATGAEKVQSASMMWRQNKLFREHALGDFRALTQSIAKDPAMLIYLDSASNRKAHPNENFARELMELFCLGEGNYSEDDVLELARCFTGWEIRNERFRKNRYQHDSGSKSVLGRDGNFDGEDAVQVVLDHERLPYFICRKLFHFFICDEPSPSDDLLKIPAATFRNNDLKIAPVIRQMLSSNLFFSHCARARKIKSPVESVIGLLRGLEVAADSNQIAEGLRSIGQGLFYPPNVKGWDGGRSWVNSSTLLGRANLFQRIIFDKKTRFGDETLDSYLKRFSATTFDGALDHFQRCLMAVPIGSSARELLRTQFPMRQKLSDSNLRRLLHSVASLPEFQLC
ncbi:MAG: DUF1800 domain-containing protein [Planctomycetota bacterium]